MKGKVPSFACRNITTASLNWSTEHIFYPSYSLCFYFPKIKWLLIGPLVLFVVMEVSKHHCTARLSDTLCFPSLRYVFASSRCSSQLVTSVWTCRIGAAVRPVCTTHERLLLGNHKTLGDWGCWDAWGGRVKWRGGEFEGVKGLHSSEAEQLLFCFATVLAWLGLYI